MILVILFFIFSIHSPVDHVHHEGNVLILRNDIEIRPYDRPTVSYEYLVELLGDYLLNVIPQNEAEVDL